MITPSRWCTAFLVVLCVVFYSLPNDLLAQSVRPTPNVFLDCGSCSFDYIRSNVTFVNYVRDQADANIYLRITDYGTGSGREFVLDFRGIPPFSTRRDTIVYFSSNLDTSDERRAGLVRHIRIGLLPFMTGTEVFKDLDVRHTTQSQIIGANIPVSDPWKSWIFDIDLGASFDGEESEFSYELEGGFNAERITDLWKIEVDGEVEIDRTSIELSSGTRKVNRDSWDFDGFLAYSMGDHFSVGLFSSVSATQTGNIRLNLEASPAIEYSFFPYREFQERRLLLQYRITPSYRNYDQTTIYLKDDEIVAQQVLSSRLRYDQPWGQIDIRVSASNYMHDIDLHRFSFNPYADIRITRGLSFYVSARYDIINDQISLPADDITDTERLLGERQQATSYDYGLSFGLSFTFGSKYSNVVNPRLD
jgi:hypothetical protein